MVGERRDDVSMDVKKKKKKDEMYKKKTITCKPEVVLLKKREQRTQGIGQSSQKGRKRTTCGFGGKG